MECGDGSHQKDIGYTRVVSLLFQMTAEERSQVWTWEQGGAEGKARHESAWSSEFKEGGRKWPSAPSTLQLPCEVDTNSPNKQSGQHLRDII